MPVEPLDEHIDLDLTLVDRADGSQARALVRAIAGETMLIEGPPGTGKSQTITNLVAAALEQGKRVLFVSEKLAALDVVRRRMEALGLGEFCLELHSEKARKRALLDDIERSLRRRAAPPLPDRAAAIAQLRKIAANSPLMVKLCWRPLRATTNRSMRSCPGQPCYGAPPKMRSYRLHSRSPLKDKLAMHRPQRGAVDPCRCRATIADLGCAARQHPWAGMDATVVQPFQREQIVASLNAWADALRERDTVAGAMRGSFWPTPEREPRSRRMVSRRHRGVAHTGKTFERPATAPRVRLPRSRRVSGVTLVRPSLIWRWRCSLLRWQARRPRRCSVIGSTRWPIRPSMPCSTKSTRASSGLRKPRTRRCGSYAAVRSGMRIRRPR